MDATTISGSHISSWIIVFIATGPLRIIHVPHRVTRLGRGPDILPNFPDGIIQVVVCGIVAMTLPLLYEGGEDVTHGLV
jgi:hypothetical protein